MGQGRGISFSTPERSTFLSGVLSFRVDISGPRCVSLSFRDHQGSRDQVGVELLSSLLQNLTSLFSVCFEVRVKVPRGFQRSVAGSTVPFPTGITILPRAELSNSLGDEGSWIIEVSVSRASESEQSAPEILCRHPEQRLLHQVRQRGIYRRGWGHCSSVSGPVSPSSAGCSSSSLTLQASHGQGIWVVSQGGLVVKAAGERNILCLPVC